MQRFRSIAGLAQLRGHSIHSHFDLVTHRSPKNKIAALLQGRQIHLCHYRPPKILESARLTYEHGEYDESPTVEDVNCSKRQHPTKHNGAASHAQAIISQQRQTTHALIDAYLSKDIPKILSFHAPGYQHAYVDRINTKNSTDYTSSLSRAFKQSEIVRIVIYNIFESTKARTVKLSLFIEADYVNNTKEESSPETWITWILHFDRSGEKILKCEESRLDDEERFGLWLS